MMFELTSNVLYHDTTRNATGNVFSCKIMRGGRMVSQLKTIRQTAALGILSEYYLRIRHRHGKLPGVYSGNRFLVDTEALMEMLRTESLEAVRREAGNNAETTRAEI
jgi:hypothetical protein